MLVHAQDHVKPTLVVEVSWVEHPRVEMGILRNISMASMWLKGGNAQTVILVRFDVDEETRAPRGMVDLWKLNDAGNEVRIRSMVSVI